MPANVLAKSLHRVMLLVKLMCSVSWTKCATWATVSTMGRRVRFVLSVSSTEMHSSGDVSYAWYVSGMRMVSAVVKATRGCKIACYAVFVGHCRKKFD